MAQIIDLNRRRRRRRQTVYFTRDDLNRLLSLFSRQVIANEWLDYTIDAEEGYAVFCVYRRAHESPLYKIFRLAPEDSANGAYLIMDRKGKASQTADLQSALHDLARPAKAVWPPR